MDTKSPSEPAGKQFHFGVKPTRRLGWLATIYRDRAWVTDRTFAFRGEAEKWATRQCDALGREAV